MGEKRRELVKKFGIDVKNASHLIRLLTMCKEFLSTGEMNVFRCNEAQFLMAIKRGELPLEEIKYFADCLFKDIDVAFAECKFHDSPDTDAAERLCMDIISDYYSWGP